MREPAASKGTIIKQVAFGGLIDFPGIFTGILFSLFYFAERWLTVCVTCAGAGTAKPSDLKNAEAWKTA